LQSIYFKIKINVLLRPPANLHGLQGPKCYYSAVKTKAKGISYHLHAQVMQHF